jgi:hypothetical protein
MADSGNFKNFVHMFFFFWRFGKSPSLVPRHSHVPIWMPDPNLESECEKQLQEGHGNVW